MEKQMKESKWVDQPGGRDMEVDDHFDTEYSVQRKDLNLVSDLNEGP